MKRSEFTKNQNDAVNVSNEHRKCSILLLYHLLHVYKVFWNFFRTVDGIYMVFKHIFIRILIQMFQNIVK